MLKFAGKLCNLGDGKFCFGTVVEPDGRKSSASDELAVDSALLVALERNDDVGRLLLGESFRGDF